ncbi:MAG: LamG domain-containing protein [Lachnospiraceae bacterium]
MFKKFLSGVLAAAMVAGGASYMNTATADAAAPKPDFYFNMDKANKNVVAVARKGDTTNFTAGNMDTGVMPEAANAKKVKLKYEKGKKGKALHLDRKSSYGAELKKVKVGSGSWTVSFWVKPESALSDAMPIFFTGSKITDPKNTKWISITSHSDWELGGNPVVWSHSTTNGAKDEFPWYGYNSGEEGLWEKKEAVPTNQWTHITMIVDASDTCEYGAEGDDGYVKALHGWTFVNGKLHGNGTIAHNTMSNSNRFFLGINCWDTPFKGWIDDVKIWKKAIVTSKSIGKKNGLKNAEKVIKSIM